jgi:hypothetical protein
LVSTLENGAFSALQKAPNPAESKSELLDVNVDVTDPNMEKHMRAAKNHLRSYGVTYMDWKCTNVGVDSTGTYKLFDFNLSGYKENGNWIMQPYPGGYAYKRAMRNGFQDILDMDDYSFSRAF